MIVLGVLLIVAAFFASLGILSTGDFD